MTSPSHQVATIPNRRTGSSGLGFRGFATARDHRRPTFNWRLQRPAADRSRFETDTSTCGAGAFISGTTASVLPRIECAPRVLAKRAGAASGGPLSRRTALVPIRGRPSPVHPGYRICAAALVPSIERRRATVGIIREDILLEECNRCGDDPALCRWRGRRPAVLTEYTVSAAIRPGGLIAVRDVRRIEIDDVSCDGHILGPPQA